MTLPTAATSGTATTTVRCAAHPLRHVPTGDLERIVRAALAVLAGVATQAAGGSVSSAAGRPAGRDVVGRTRVVGVAGALLGAAFGFVAEDPARGLSLRLDEVPAYLIVGLDPAVRAPPGVD